MSNTHHPALTRFEGYPDARGWPGASGRAYWVVLTTLMLLIGILAFVAPANAQNLEYSRFLGSYAGDVVIPTSGGLERRNLHVAIQPTGDGFRVEWSTVIHKSTGKVKRRNFRATFKPVTHDTFYTSTHDSGAERPGTQIDPIYATIEGDKLSVFAYQITADGQHEVQIYERVLVPGGLDLNFVRSRNHQPMKTIRAKLVTQKK